MNLLHVEANITLALIGLILFFPVLLFTAWQVHQRFLADHAAQHAWLGGAVGIALLWILEIHPGPGPSFGMLGCALYALMFGRARAILGLTLALVIHMALHGGAWLNFGLNGLLFAVVPALTASLMQERIEALLPPNLFIFMIGNGLFTTFVATVVTNLLLIMTVQLGEVVTPVHNLGDYIEAALLLSWGEAIVTGMIFTILVVYFPSLVLTYRSELYLSQR